MNTSIRYELLKLLRNCQISFNTANKFVLDDEVKFKLFQDAYLEQDRQDQPQSHTPKAVEVAEARWSVISAE